MRRHLPATAALALFAGLLGLTDPAAGQEKAARAVALPAQPVKPAVGIAVGQPGEPDGGADNLTDDQALKKAGLSPTDGPKLIEYLRLRTLSDADQGKIAGIIKRFGVDDFDERVKAAEEIEAFGPAAIGPLRKAAEDRNGDPEVVFRARVTLKRLETVPHSAVAAAAVRAVVKLKPEGAAGALVGFLPVADTEAVGEVIRGALVSLAARDGKADPALVAALSDKLPVRRAAAYVALTEGGPAGERVRIKDAYPKVKEAVLGDADVEAKFIGLWTLALTTREKEFVPELISMIPELPRGRIWQLEELLLLMAKEHPKDGRFLKSPEALAKARDAWLGWWKEKGEKLDLVKFEYKPRVAGITEVIEMHSNGYGPGAVVSLGPDLKEKWRITGVQYATDVRVAPDGKVWVVESSNSRITERDTTGKILRTRYANNQPLNIELLPGGEMLVFCRDRVFQWDKTGTKEVWTTPQRPNYDLMAGCRLPGGEILFVTNTQGENAFRLTAKGEDANKGNDPKRKLQFGQVQQLQSMHAFAEDRVLVCEYNKVAEYDLKTGKQVWKRDTPQNSAQSCQRLPNGNTLIALLNQNQVIEVDPSGEIVWEYAAKDGLRVGRAYRR